MKIQISGHNMPLTQALQDSVHEKMKHLKACTDLITNFHVVLSAKKAEAELHVPGKVIVAKAENQDLYVAINELSHKLERQLMDYKEKNLGHQD